jgi:NAD(P)-dependent dehydrogenase (short-subunit alcohol dehydrogenase family)
MADVQAEATARAILANGGTATGVTSPKSQDRLVARIAEAYGRLNVLVNNEKPECREPRVEEDLGRLSADAGQRALHVARQTSRQALHEIGVDRRQVVLSVGSTYSRSRMSGLRSGRWVCGSLLKPPHASLPPESRHSLGYVAAKRQVEDGHLFGGSASGRAWRATALASV